jgi:uncharacterized caspase-like protein
LLSYVLPLFLLAAAAPARAQTQEPDAKSITQTENPRVTVLPEKAKRYAVVIGIDKYTSDTNIPTLHGAANDARAIADALVKYAGFEMDKVTLLSSDMQDSTRQPTKSNIWKVLKNLKYLVDDGGMLVVAFSGHGVERKTDHQVFLLPADALSDPDDYELSAISVGQVKDFIKQTKANQVMLLLDSCRNDPTGGKGTEDNKLTKSYADAFKMSGVKAFVTFYAASEGQRAWEYQDKQQGYFSWAFVEGLKGAARDEATGEVTLGRLIGFVESEVTKRAGYAGKVQRPWAQMDGYGGNLVISKVEPVAPPKSMLPPAPVAPTTGMFSVVSVSGAQIVIEPLSGDKAQTKTGAIPEGQSFYNSGSLPFGRYRITATRDGYVTDSKVEEIGAGKLNPQVELSLKVVTYTVTIKSNVSKGKVELGLKGEAPRVYELRDGQVVVSGVSRGDYVANVIPADIGYGSKSEPLVVNGDLTHEIPLVSKLRTQPLNADFSLTEQWELPAGWHGTHALEVNGEGRMLLRDTANWFADLELSANVTLVGGTSVSFIVRAEDEKNYYLVRLCGPHADTPNKLRIFLVKDGQQPRHIQSFSLSGFQLTDQFLFDMKVIGGHFEFFVDDNRGTSQREGLVIVGDVTDDTLRAGSVGIAAGPGDKAKLSQYLVYPR